MFRLEKGTYLFSTMQSIIAGDSWGLLAIPLLENTYSAYFILFPAFLHDIVGGWGGVDSLLQPEIKRNGSGAKRKPMNRQI